MLIIMYRSDAIALLPHSSLSDIFFQSVANNTKHGITGILVEYEGTFIQILEGEPEAVERLYGNISCDPRHEKVTLLLREFVSDERSFNIWAMNYGPLAVDFFRGKEFRDFRHPMDFKISSYDPEFSLRFVSRAYAYAHLMAADNPVIGNFLKGEITALSGDPPEVKAMTVKDSKENAES